MIIFSFAEVLFASIAAAFIAAFFTTPFIIFNSRKANIVGSDRNKKNEKIPEMGGIAIVTGTALGILIAIAFGFNLQTDVLISGLDIQILLAALATVLFMGILGLIDDLYALERKIKAPIPFIAAIPLSAVRAGTRNLNLPLIGSLNFGSFYSLVIVPIGVGGASNAFNMLAGLNGLEAGLGAVMSLAVLIAAYAKGSLEAMIISASLFGACLAFLFYNRFPAKIFPGDVGTYPIGATIATAVIIGNLEFFGLFLFLPHFIELVLKLRTRFRGENYGILKKGLLYPPKKIESLTHIVMRFGPMTEGQVVNRILLAEAAVAIIALALFV
ncbi:MAG: hypothetical protein V1835_05190 [Candidatus Micrarchaeota archaeon]